MQATSIKTRLAALLAAFGLFGSAIAAVPMHAEGAGSQGQAIPTIRGGIDGLPLELPGGGAVAARAGGDWLIGVRPTAAAERMVRQVGGRRVPVRGTWRVPTGRVRSLSRRLQAKGLLVWAQSNPVAQRQASLDGQEGAWARAAVVPPPLTPPSPAGVPIGVVDDLVDPQNPDVGAQTRHVNGSVPMEESHGTQVASVAAGLQNGTGVTGVLSGAPILSYGMTDWTCAGIATGISALVKAGARVINISLGVPEACVPLYWAVSEAHARGIIVVAAAGNSREDGNPVLYPAAFPHVLSVGAVDHDLSPAPFSTANPWVDLAAPGVDVATSLPLSFDVNDGAQDGVTLAAGTSFAAPMTAGAAAWLLAARPDSAPAQIADLLRHSARDLGPRGWDVRTGYGLLDVSAALAAEDPPLDPIEPNDEIAFVDGTAFGQHHSPVWNGVGHHSLAATADAAEDPTDVYRVRIPARAKVAIRLRPRYGNPNLYVFDGSAKSFDDAPIAASRRGPGRADTVRLANPSGRARTAYVAIEASTAAGASIDTGYQLEFQRRRR